MRRWPDRLSNVQALVLLVGAAGSVAVGACGVGDTSEAAPKAHFRSPPAADGATVWAVGDGADGSAAGRRVARLIAADRPDQMLYLGDVYETGSAREFRENYGSTYGRFKSVTAPTPGNHDWLRHAEGYDTYWARNGRGPPHHYSLEVAGWEVLSLNSESRTDSRSAQGRWLRRQLAGSGNCRIAFWHRPRYSAGSHGDDEKIEPLWSPMAGKVRLVLNGHEHNMQQLRPQDGVTELISGAGGRARYEFDRSYRRLAWGNDRTYGALRLRLTRGRARYQFVGVGGRVLRRGSARCQRPSG